MLTDDSVQNSDEEQGNIEFSKLIRSNTVYCTMYNAHAIEA